MRYLNKIIEYGILLFVFLIPWQARWIIRGGELNGGYWEYGTASLYATEALLGLILLAIVVKGAIWFKRNRLRFDWQRLFSPSGALLPLVIWSGLSIFWTIDANAALQHWVFLVLAAALFVVMGFSVPSPFKGEGGVRVGHVIILSAAIQAAIALIQFFSQSIPASTVFGVSAQSAGTLGASVVETVSGRWLRAYGTFPHPNILGAWLVLGLVLLTRSINRHSEPSRFAQGKLREESHGLTMRFLPRIKCGVGMTRVAAFVVILSGLLVTFSRAAWLALFIGLLVYWFISRGQNQRIAVSKIIAVTIITVVTLVTLFPEPFAARLSSSNRLEIKSSAERTVSLTQSWQIIKKYPLTGVGIGNYGLAVYRELDNTKPAWYYQPAHNVLLLIWSELGLIGILVIGYWLLVIWRGVHRSRFETIAYLLPLAILSLFDHYLWSLYPGMMLAAVWFSLQRHEP